MRTPERRVLFLQLRFPMDRDSAMNGYRHARRGSSVTVRNPLQRRLTQETAQDSPAASNSAVDSSFDALEWDYSVTNPAYAHMQHATACYTAKHAGQKRGLPAAVAK